MAFGMFYFYVFVFLYHFLGLVVIYSMTRDSVYIYAFAATLSWHISDSIGNHITNLL